MTGIYSLSPHICDEDIPTSNPTVEELPSSGQVRQSEDVNNELVEPIIGHDEFTRSLTSSLSDQPNELTTHISSRQTNQNQNIDLFVGEPSSSISAIKMEAYPPLL